MRCSLQLGLEQRQRQPRADERDVGLLAQQVGHGADVVLVAVGEHDRRRCRRGGRGCSRSRAGSGRRRAGGPRGTARRSRRRAAGRRTRRPSCCGRSRRARRAATTRSPPSGSAGGAAELGVRMAHSVDGSGRVLEQVGAQLGDLRRRSRRPAAGARCASASTPSSCSAALAVIAPCVRVMIARTRGAARGGSRARSRGHPPSTAPTIAA